MPDMDGLQLLENLYLSGSEIPLIFLTGFRDVTKMKAAWRFCAYDFLDKPFNIQQMIDVIDCAHKYGADYVRSARIRSSKLK